MWYSHNQYKVAIWKVISRNRHICVVMRISCKRYKIRSSATCLIIATHVSIWICFIFLSLVFCFSLSVLISLSFVLQCLSIGNPMIQGACLPNCCLFPICHLFYFIFFLRCVDNCCESTILASLTALIKSRSYIRWEKKIERKKRTRWKSLKWHNVRVHESHNFHSCRRHSTIVAHARL